MDAGPSGLALPSLHTVRSLSAIHLRSLSLEPAAAAAQNDKERAPRQRRRSSASSTTRDMPMPTSASIRRSKSRSSTTSSLNTLNDSTSLPQPTPASPTSLLSAVEAPALSTRTRAASSASGTSRLRESVAGDVKLQRHDEASQEAARAAIRARVNRSCRFCRLVLLDAAGDNVLWSSTELQSKRSDSDWVLHFSQDVRTRPALMGLRQVRVDIWALSVEAEHEHAGKGKQKAADQDAADSEWDLLLSYAVDLTALTNLGSNVSAFPAFDANSLVLQFDAPDYFLVPPATLKPSQPKRVKFEQSQSEVVLRSLRETKLLQAASPDDLYALLSREKERSEAQVQLQTGAMDPTLRQTWHVRRACSQQAESTECRRQATTETSNQTNSLRVKLAEKQERLEARKQRLSAAHEQLLDQNQALGNFKRKTDLLSNKLAQVEGDLAVTRASLLSTLDFVLPIEPTDSPLLFSLVQLPLPNSEGLTEEHASVLGLAALLVNILAAYLGVGLHYPLLFSGSRSLAVDNISLIKGPRSFPLYAQGVEEYRFQYAVFLLNKNIEQLCMSQAVLCTDLRQTLPNLKNLILTVTARPSASRQSTKATNGSAREAEQDIEEPLSDAISSPTASEMLGSDCSTIRPKRNQSPTPSEKVRRVTKSVTFDSSARSKEGKDANTLKSKPRRRTNSIPEHQVVA